MIFFTFTNIPEGEMLYFRDGGGIEVLFPFVFLRNVQQLLLEVLGIWVLEKN